jgi:hypothetical protein
MARTDSFLDTVHGPLVPAMGTLPTKANTLYPKGTIVTMNTAGRAISPATADVSGFPAHGVSKATFDNRTGSEMGGLDDSGFVEIDYGVFGFAYTDTPIPGDTVYVVDNQTVSDDSDSGQRGVAGVCTEIRDGLCFVWMGPHVADLWSDDSALGTAVTNAEADIDALEADALTAQAVIPVPLNSFRIYADGEALIPFVDGTDGIDFTAESMGYRFNDDTTAAIAASVLMPNDLDDAAAVVVHVLGYRVGAADATAALTVGAFFRVAGSAFSADADAGGDTTAFDGATTVVTEETLSIAAGDVPASPSSLLLTLVPTAALDSDDLVVLEVWLEYTRKLLTA